MAPLVAWCMTLSDNELEIPYILTISLQETPDSTNATSVYQDQAVYSCRVIIVCIVCYSDNTFFESFPKILVLSR
jgi:hypothetical protein